MGNAYAPHVNTRQTPQDQPLAGQVPNSAGGFTFALDDWSRLRRFLILGSEGGTYYATERDLTIKNSDCVKRCIATDGVRTVKMIEQVSQEGAAPKNDPAVFALAMCAGLGNPETKSAAYAALQSVCRIGTHLFQFAECVEKFRGWGKGLQHAVANWYRSKPSGVLAYQAVKYQQRNGWSHNDLLRLSHAKPLHNVAIPALNETLSQATVFSWIKHGLQGTLLEPPQANIIWAFEKAKTAKTVQEIVPLIENYKLPKECVPSQFYNEPAVWDALLPHMGTTALLRNLGKLSSVGLLTPLSAAANTVMGRLTDSERLRKDRVHPIHILTAMKVYEQGHPMERGPDGRFRAIKYRWNPMPQVVDACDRGFYAAFRAVLPTGKRWLLALDCSGSMGQGQVGGSPLTPREAAGAMALVTANVEASYHAIVFSGRGFVLRTNRYALGHSQPPGVESFPMSPRQRLTDVTHALGAMPFGPTDCALPMLYALENKFPVDVFVVYTDNETWHGDIHPVQALAKYRQTMGIPAKLIVVGMTATEFTIADPNDAGSMDVVGFDATAPAVMADFAR